MKRHNTRINAAFVMLCVTLAAGAFAAEAPPTKDASLDDLLNIPGAPKKPVEPAKPVDPSKPSVDGPPPEVTEGTHPSGEPFEAAIDDMKKAAGRLDAQDPSVSTQRMQESAIRRLDQLISDARKQQDKSKSKSKQREKDSGDKSDATPKPQPGEAQKPSQAKDSNSGVSDRQKAEDARIGDTPIAEKLAEWGNLPPRLRDQLLQGMDDKYSQVYREMTEKYYRRLAEQNR